MGKYVALWVLCSVFTWSCSPNYKKISGSIYGTFFHITYLSDTDFGHDIRRELERLNEVLSMFNPDSEISRFNDGMSIAMSPLFVRMYEKALEAHEMTWGAFDITVAPLINVWGFGYREEGSRDSLYIDSLMNFVGMDKLYTLNDTLYKRLPGVRLDASGIAKGLGVDVVAEFLDSKGITDYLVEVGGELRVKGHNKEGKMWKIGIDKPLENNILNREITMSVRFDEGAMATSGNYRNFYVKDNKRYVHTINPKTGYPFESDIISASVYAPTCMEADVYATAFMVLGFEKTKRLLKEKKDLEAFLIYKENDEMKYWNTEGFEKLKLE